MERPIMRYSDNVNTAHAYDIVRIRTGIFTNKLAIVVKVNFKVKTLDMQIIDNSIKITLNKNVVDFCYHNTKSAAKQWFNIMKRKTIEYAKSWQNIKYIHEHWNDVFHVNEYSIKVIADILDVWFPDKAMYFTWWYKIEDVINAIMNNLDSNVINLLICKVNDKTINHKSINKLYYVIYSKSL